MAKSDRKTIPLPSTLLEQTRLLGDALNNEDDLPCALIATSFLEHCLASLLQAFMVDGNTSKDLLQPGRPLGEFVARAKACYCLGLIPSSMLNEITKISAIRNHFAHNFSGVKFDDPEISAMCNELDSHLPNSPPAWWTPRKNFERTIFLLVNELLKLADNTGHLQAHAGKGGDWLMSRGR
jgi:DNA-binding MltR family transcriptional regulator